MKIGIALATFNSEKYLRDQIDSILSQTFKDWVCYIHDDGSTDKTMEIIEEYRSKYPGNFKILAFEPMKSAKNNFMKILEYIHEPYIMFSDHDDYWKKDKIEIEYLKIKESEKIYPNIPLLVFTDVEVVNHKLDITDKSYAHFTGYDPRKYLKINYALTKNVSNGCTMIFNQKLLQLLLMCRDFDNIIMHDYWVYLVGMLYGHIDYMDVSTMLYRQHFDNVCGAVKKSSFIQKRINDVNNLRFDSFDDLINRKKSWILDLQKQAEELVLLKRYQEPIDLYGYDLVKKFSYLKNKNKLYRLLFYFKNSFFIKGMKLRLLAWG